MGSADRAEVARQNVLTSNQEKALLAIAPMASANGFFLAGGTALAMQIHHRRSRDFDFFSPSKFDDPTQFVQSIQSAGINFTVNRIARGTVFGSVDGVEISFLEYLYPVINPTIKAPEYPVDLVDPIDIAAMKINAIIQRGMLRDFIDVYALLKSGVSIQDMINAYRKKYSVENIRSILVALNYFDDAESGIMPDMIWPINWKVVKKTISNAVADYVKNKGRA